MGSIHSTPEEHCLCRGPRRVLSAVHPGSTVGTTTSSVFGMDHMTSLPKGTFAGTGCLQSGTCDQPGAWSSRRNKRSVMSAKCSHASASLQDTLTTDNYHTGKLASSKKEQTREVHADAIKVGFHHGHQAPLSSCVTVPHVFSPSWQVVGTCDEAYPMLGTDLRLSDRGHRISTHTLR